MKKDGEVILDFKEQCNGFTQFYEDLAVPSNNDSFDQEYKDRVDADIELSKYNNSEVDRTCPLCRLEDEDIVHFLTKCNSLHHYRRQYLLELKNLFDGALQAYWLNLTKDFILLTKLILDAVT